MEILLSQKGRFDRSESRFRFAKKDAGWTGVLLPVLRAAVLEATQALREKAATVIS